ncbi:MAG: S10 family peptidase [Vulcanimicrobiaceae bacterium]
MVNLKSILALSTAIALLAAAPAAAPKKSPVSPATPDALSHHVAQVGGVSIRYTARAGTVTLRNDKDEITARMFYVAYTKDDADSSKRPVTFFYNGGPGSSTVWLHMGSFAPVKVVTTNGAPTGPAPYKLVNNSYSLLDKTDMVFVDAPNTGYSRVLGAGQPKDFMGVDQDGRAFTQFIERYISQFNRWGSPKFLFGESYGTTRDCVLVNMLQGAGVQMNGVVLQSSILNFGLGGLGGGQPIGGGDWSYVTYLPTEAATAWYHHKANSHGQNLDTFLKGVEEFADGQYLHDLAQGADLGSAQYDADVHRLHDYLGVSEQYIRNSNLRVPYPRFQQELLRNQGTVIGRYDGRFMTYDLDSAADRAPWDPSDVGISGAFVGTFNQYIRDTLRYNTNMQYRPVSYGGLLGAPWDMHHHGDDPPPNVAPDLAEAMTQNPHLRVFSANGRYDFATPYFATVYTLEHLGLAPALQKNITYGFYESGHMIYLNPASLAQYKTDLAHWYDSALAGR